MSEEEKMSSRRIRLMYSLFDRFKVDRLVSTKVLEQFFVFVVIIAVRPEWSAARGTGRHG